MDEKAPQGNKSVLKFLIKLSKNKKIPHAYIFYGPKGVGKKQFALYFAKLLNCLAKSEDQRPCHSCISCHKIDNNIHPDLKIIATDRKQIKIDEIREVTVFTNTSALEGRFKVIIIDDAHKMNVFSANALLKTLEEPLSNSIIILITDNLKNLLPTIQSRCIKIPFSPLKDEEILQILSQKGYDISKINDILPFCAGSVKIAEELLIDKNYAMAIDLIENLEKFGHLRFIEISAISERISQNNFEETSFNIMLQFFRNKALKMDENLFSYLSAYEKVLIFMSYLRYNISKSFILEALFLSLSSSEDT